MNREAKKKSNRKSFELPSTTKSQSLASSASAIHMTRIQPEKIIPNLYELKDNLIPAAEYAISLQKIMKEYK